MARKQENLWRGLEAKAQRSLSARDYDSQTLAQRLASVGVDGSEIVGASKDKLRASWIRGVRIFPRTIYPQRHRGVFGELARRDEGALAGSNFWPTQWAAARMNANSAKGFHVHPPFIPEGEDAAKWLEKKARAQPDYEREQWDLMFFVQGRVEMILRDVRAGFSPRTMRFFIDGDNHRGPNNVGVIVPPGVAHALRVEGSEDVIMVYGTSTTFRPEVEGRIACEIETAQLPDSWQKFLVS